MSNVVRSFKHHDFIAIGPLTCHLRSCTNGKLMTDFETSSSPRSKGNCEKNRREDPCCRVGTTSVDITIIPHFHQVWRCLGLLWPTWRIFKTPRKTGPTILSSVGGPAKKGSQEIPQHPTSHPRCRLKPPTSSFPAARKIMISQTMAPHPFAAMLLP